MADQAGGFWFGDRNMPPCKQQTSDMSFQNLCRKMIGNWKGFEM